MIRLSYDVFCDLCGSWLHAFISGNGNRKSKARAVARKKGWLYQRGNDGRFRDICPSCAKTPPERRATGAPVNAADENLMRQDLARFRIRLTNSTEEEE